MRPPCRERARLTLVPSARRRSSSTRSSSGSLLRAAAAFPARRLRLAQPPHQLLGLPHGQLLPDDRIQHACLELGREAAERTPVPLGQPPVGDRRLDLRRELEQSKRVDDRRARPADAVRHVVLAEPEPVDRAGGRRRPSRADRDPRAAGSRRGRAPAGRDRSSWRTTAGIRSRPAAWAARSRRSPATSW